MPVLLGGGIRLFEKMAINLTNLEPVDVLHTPAATHLRYRLVRE